MFIENDTNSLGYNQWFYFSVRNNSANTKYTFRLVNFVTVALLRKKNILSSSMAVNQLFSQWRAIIEKAMAGVGVETMLYMSNLPSIYQSILKISFILFPLTLPFSKRMTTC